VSGGYHASSKTNQKFGIYASLACGGLTNFLGPVFLYNSQNFLNAILFEQMAYFSHQKPEFNKLKVAI
jgi:hypothetical protein